MRLLPILALGLLAGCATTPTGSGGADARGPEVIAYRTQPCFGTCPVYEVRVTRAGDGVFTGTAHTAVIGERRFSVTPAQFDRFAATLALARPARDRRLVMGGEGCRNAPTDMPAVEVDWTDGTGAVTRLHAYGGCRAGNEAMFGALDAAPSTLPIADLIGRR